jgi:UDP-N-acetylmuramyl pentapeptide phosphotransferase/UDP-N-acetylglucosamine-1-phosphate transferase
MQDAGLIVSILVLTAVTFTDDRKSLPAWQRLIMQIAIGVLLFATGTRIYTITNPLGGILKLDTVDIPSMFFGPLPLWSGVFTMAWIILTTNAFNWLDGIPGQVSILSVIGAATIGFLSLSARVNQPEIALMAFTLAGVALGSAVFDFPPNRTVMGDTGAMFFGLMLGALSMYAGGKVATAFLVLGVPLVDAVLVLVRRMMEGRSPLAGGRDHLHHLLLDRRNWSERQVIALTVFLGTSFGITALFLSTFQKFVAIILLVVVMLGLTWYALSGRTPSVTHRR